MELRNWKIAERPNYVDNIDMQYPYSELPYLGEYHLVKIPTSNQLIEHVDYWGEGRIVTKSGTSGFPHCYNVNRQYQLVSNGDDMTRKIPNRIPVVSESICDTTSYIKTNSVKLVTVMGAPIIDSSAADISRIVNSIVGQVVVFGFQHDDKAIQLVNTALNKVSLFYCPAYELPEYLQGLTLFNDHRAYLNATDMEEQLYNAVTGGSYDIAVDITQSLAKNSGGFVVASVVDKLLQHGIRNLMPYAYKLWNAGEKEIISNYFPVMFTSVFNEEKIKIVSNYYNMALKLDVNVDSYNDRLAWGDMNDHTSATVSWMLIPKWEGNNVVYKIKNNKYGMFLKLDVNVVEGDRLCWGSNDSSEVRHKWTLEPIKLKDEVVFLVINYKYKQGLKLDAHTDSYGDRQLWGNNGNVLTNPRYFGWLFKPW